MNTVTTNEGSFAICVRNDGYPASLEVRKIYRVIADTTAAQQHYLRVTDESGEDYLYPDSYFTPIELPQPVKEALFLTA
ncbi:MAG: hypothetical protein IVW55_13255 [Chloroflexi bacterium]|nr:hypothetical protein [Chloroflexota bacterium]